MEEYKIKESDIKKQIVYKGRVGIILWVRDHYCAYAETDLKIDYDQGLIIGGDGSSPSNIINVHGGLTYSDELNIEGKEKRKWFFGIDFAHSGDHIDSSYGCIDCKHGTCHKWTLEEVEIELKRLIDEVILYEIFRRKAEIIAKDYLKRLIDEVILYEIFRRKAEIITKDYLKVIENIKEEVWKENK